MTTTTLPTPDMFKAPATETPAAPVAPVAAPMAAPAAPVAPMAAPAAPMAAPAAPAVAAPIAAPVTPGVAAAVPTKEKKEKKERSDVNITSEHIAFIQANIATNSVVEIATKCGITKNQVNRVINDLRTKLRMAIIAKDPESYAKTGELNKKGQAVYDYSNPITEAAQKVEALIATRLSRPASEGGVTRKAGGGGSVKKAIDDAFDSLFKDLGI